MEELKISANMIGQASRAALVFDDQETTVNFLRALSVKPNLVSAHVYDKEGELFAHYSREDDDKKLPLFSQFILLGNSSMSVDADIQLDGEVVGRVDVKSDLKGLAAQLDKFLLICLAVFMLAFLLSSAISVRMQQLIAEPISSLSNLMKKVSDRKDYSLRVESFLNNEIGDLQHCFNEMLSTIQQQEIDLRMAKDKAEAADEAKSKFLAVMSHEVRTPLNGIVGTIQLLSETELDKDQQEYVSMGVNSSQNLLNVVNEVLDYSKLEAERMEVNLRTFDLVNQVETTTGIFRVMAREQKKDFSVSLSEDLPSSVTSDPFRLNQILTNLLSNAFKFTEEDDSIMLKVFCDSSDSSRVYFKVMDSGIGIPEENQKEIFSDFVQSNNSLGKTFQGTGLGLSICAKLISLLGGKITVDSKPDAGACFLFSIENSESIQDSKVVPISNATNPDRDKTLDHSGMPAVLVVDDDKIGRRLLVMMLRSMDCQVHDASSGGEAIEKFKGNSIDGIIMNCDMPVMDGHQTTRQIRKLEKSQPNSQPTYIVALTARIDRTNNLKGLESGMDDLMTKPVDKSDLSAFVKRLIEEQKKQRLAQT